MEKAKRALTILAFATTLISCNGPMLSATPPEVDSVVLKLHTSRATQKLIQNFGYYYHEQHTEIRLEIRVARYSELYKGFEAGQIPYFISHHISGLNDVWAAPIGNDALGIFVHPANPIKGLSLDELRAIYQGHITNWKELGGFDQEIIVLLRDAGSSPALEFNRLVMGSRIPTANAQLLVSEESLLSSIKQQEGAIGYGFFSGRVDGVETLSINHIALNEQTVLAQTYPLRVGIYLIGQSEPQDEFMREFIAWIQGPEGQGNLLEDFIPLFP